MYSGASRGTPLGCLTGVLATIPLGLAIISGYGLWRWLGAPPDERPEGSLGVILGSFVGGLAFFILLGWVSFRIIRTTSWRNYDPGNDTSLHH